MLQLNGVESFLSSTNGFMNLSVVQEGKLLRRDIGKEDRFNTTRNDFGYNLV